MGTIAGRCATSHTVQAAPTSIDEASVREQAMEIHPLESRGSGFFAAIPIASDGGAYAGSRVRWQETVGVDDL